MALKDILGKIEKEGKSQIKDLESEFSKKKKELEKEQSRLEKKIEKDLSEKLSADKAKIKEKATTEAEMEAKNRLLTAKREIIDETLEQAVASLASADDYEQILTEMLKKVDTGEEAEIVPSRGKEEATRKALQASGKSFSLSPHSADIKGGFIVRGKKIEVDNSFETIIGSQLRPSLEIELNKLLFS